MACLIQTHIPVARALAYPTSCPAKRHHVAECMFVAHLHVHLPTRKPVLADQVVPAKDNKCLWCVLLSLGSQIRFYLLSPHLILGGTGIKIY